MEFLDVIKSRRSVRSYRDEQIKPEELELIIEAGRNAPSYQNRQCWRFLVIDDKELIEKVAFNSGLVGTVNLFIKTAPTLIIACADPSKSGGINKQDYYLVDTAIAFQQMMLTAWSLGIGSCWMAAFDEKKLKKLLQIPEKIRVVAMSPFGYPKEQESVYGKIVKAFAGSKRRKKREEIVCFNEWGL